MNHSIPLSAKLILLSEWWIVPILPDSDSGIDLDKDCLQANRHMREEYEYGGIPVSTLIQAGGGNNFRSWLCLLEAEIQKDEEFHKEFVDTIL